MILHARHRSRGAVALLLGSLLLVACGGGESPTEPPPQPATALTVQTTEPTSGQPLLLRAPGRTLQAATYTGTLAGTAVQAARLTDSTLVLAVPGTVAAGARTLDLTLDGVATRTTITFVPPAPVANAAAVLTESVAQATAASERPRPAGYGASWVTDSTTLARVTAQFTAASANLTTAEREELARFLQRLRPAAPANETAALGAVATGVDDVACAATLVGLESDLTGLDAATAAAVAYKESPLRYYAAKAVAVTYYIGAVLAAGEVGNLCTLEQDFAITERATEDATGTIIELTADHRPLTVADATLSTIAARFKRLADALQAAYTFLASLFGGDGDTLTAPAPEVDSDLVAADVVVDGARVTLETTSVTDDAGTAVPITLVTDGGRLIVRAAGAFRGTVQRSLRFVIARAGYTAKVVPATVTIREVCGGALGGLVAGCVDRVRFDSRPTSVPLYNATLGNSVLLSATAYTASGAVVARTIAYRSTNAAVLSVVAETGRVTGLAAGSAQLIAETGTGAELRADTLALTVVADRTAEYRAYVAGTHGMVWAARDLLYPSPDYRSRETRFLVVFPDGTGEFYLDLYLLRDEPTAPDAANCGLVAGATVVRWPVAQRWMCKWTGVTWSITQGVTPQGAPGYFLQIQGASHPDFTNAEVSRDPLSPIFAYESWFHTRNAAGQALRQFARSPQGTWE